MSAGDLLVRLRGPSLERRLAAGEEPRADPALELRAAQLVAPRERRALAASIENVIDEVDTPSRWLSSAAPLCRPGINRARLQLVQLASELRSSRPVQAAGVVLVRRLLRDGASPLYGHSDEEALLGAIAEARHRLAYHQARES